MARKKIIAGNWKMNTSLETGIALAREIETVPIPESSEVILGVPFTHLHAVNEIVQDKDRLFCSAQNCHEKDSGAYTGEVSAEMISSISVEYVILGHSERRAYFAETDDILKEKVLTALKHGLKIIFCVGEPLEVREASKHIDLVKEQVSTALFDLEAKSISSIVIAYEPVWAIGTGKTASPDQAQEMHFAIREMFAEKYGNLVADELPILYGGSVKPSNAAELFSQKDVDGGLVGGASLDAKSFSQIIAAI